MKLLKSVLASAVATLLLGPGMTARGQYTLSASYNPTGDNIYTFNSVGSQLNGSQIVINGGGGTPYVDNWYMVDNDASQTIGNTTVINSGAPGTSYSPGTTATSYTPGTLSPYTEGSLILGAGGFSEGGGYNQLISEDNGYSTYNGITSASALGFYGAFWVTNWTGDYAAATTAPYTSFAEAAAFSGEGLGSSGILEDEVVTFNGTYGPGTYENAIDPQGGWTFVGSYAIPDTASTFELLLAAAAVAEASRRRWRIRFVNGS